MAENLKLVLISRQKPIVWIMNTTCRSSWMDCVKHNILMSLLLARAPKNSSRGHRRRLHRCCRCSCRHFAVKSSSIQPPPKKSLRNPNFIMKNPPSNKISRRNLKIGEEIQINHIYRLSYLLYNIFIVFIVLNAIVFAGALNTRNPRIICSTLKILQLISTCSKEAGKAFVPYYKSLLPILNIFKIFNRKSFKPIP